MIIYFCAIHMKKMKRNTDIKKSCPRALNKVQFQFLSGHIAVRMKGGVHICKLAYGDLTWGKLMLPKPFPFCYTMRIGSVAVTQE